MSTTNTDYLRYAWQMVNGFRTNGEKRIYAEREQDIVPYVDTSSALRVLDLGNGYLRPQYTLLKKAGYRVFGIDLDQSTRMELDQCCLCCRSLALQVEARSTSLGVDQTLICGDVRIFLFQITFRLSYVDCCF